MSDAVFKMATDWLPKLCKALVKMGEQRRAALDQVSQELLVDPADLGPCYIEPDCQLYNPADDKDADEFPVNRKMCLPAFSYLEDFINEHRPLKDGRNQLFLLSDAGMGKTSLMAMFAFAEIEGFWTKSYNCQVLKLGKDSLDRIAANYKARRTVLLLDALDEDPMAFGRIEARIQELLSASQAFHRVVLTCRTQFFPQSPNFRRQDLVELGVFVCPVIYLAWFTDAQVLRYLKKRFPTTLWQRFLRWEGARIKQAKKVILEMGPLRFRPLLLAHIQDLMDAEVETGDVRVLFESLVECWLKREQTKQLERRGKAPALDELKTACTNLAVAMDRRRARELTEAELKELLPITHPHLTTLEIGGRSLLNRNSRGQYRFAHYSIQEYLVMVNFMLSGEAPTVFTDGMRSFFPNKRVELKISGVTVGFCLIPAGKFWMGSAEDESERDEGEILHQVQISSAFWMAETVCTQALWQSIMGSNPSRIIAPNHPVTNVCYEDLKEFMTKVAESTPGLNLRLPTEAEWEYACRADSKSAFSFGAEINDDHARFGYKLKSTAQVKAYASNNWGLYQMHGNVYEWCADYFAAYDINCSQDPKGPVNGVERVLRGGSWISYGSYARSACRCSSLPGNRYDNVGFRLIVNAPMP